MTPPCAHDTVTPDIETASDAYRRRFRGPTGEYFLAVQSAAVSDLLGDPRLERTRVLEVGGGHGQLTRLFLERGCEVWVQGSAPSCSGQTRPLMTGAPGLHFVASSLFSLPFPDASFDLVCAVRVLSHVTRWKDLLSEMGRVSKRSILIDFASLASFNVLTPAMFALKRRVERDTRPYFLYTPGQLSRHLQSMHYVRRKSRKQYFFPMGVHRLLARVSISRRLESGCRLLGLTALAGSPVLMLAERASEPGRIDGDHAAAPGRRR